MKTRSKVISIVLAVIIAVSLSISTMALVYAADTPKATFSLNIESETDSQIYVSVMLDSGKFNAIEFELLLSDKIGNCTNAQITSALVAVVNKENTKFSGSSLTDYTDTDLPIAVYALTKKTADKITQDDVVLKVTYCSSFDPDGATKEILTDVTIVDNLPKLAIVTFHANGGTVRDACKIIVSGQPIGSLPIPMREKYTFDGWFTALDGGTKITENTCIDSNVTYYAHWTEKVASSEELLSYEIVDGEVIIIGCDESASGNLVIPSTIEGCSVKCIADNAFFGCCNLTSITIPAGVTDIGAYAFSSCDSLTSITVDKNNPRYSNDTNGVLYNKDKTELIQYPISNSHKSFHIPDCVSSIADGAFFICYNLTSITIPAGVTDIGAYAFSACGSLRSITVDENNAYFCNDANGVLYNHDKTELIQYPVGSLQKSFVIPDGVISIGACAFGACESLTSVTMPNSVTSIGDYAFLYCGNLTSVAIPGGVTSIGEGAFRECDALHTIFYGGMREEWDAMEKHALEADVPDAYVHFGVSAEDATTHLHTEITEEATCDDSGKMTVTCECGYSYTATIPALGHQKGELVQTVAPTCITEGYSVFRCARCDKDYESDYTDLTHHHFAENQCTTCGCVVHAITLGEVKTAMLNESETAYFQFIPETSGTYYFYSVGNEDTYASVYDSNMHLLVSNDDSGYSTNFKLSYAFEAGQTYYFAASFFSVTISGEITASLSESFSDFVKVPDATTVIDADNKFIYGLTSGIASDEILNRYVLVSDACYVDFSSDSLGTGCTLALYNRESEELLDQYTIVIFGDVNGDGWYDGTDAITVSCIANGMLSKDQVGEAVWMAADCNHDGDIDQTDVDILNQAGVLLANVDQTKTEEELQTSSSYIAYRNLIDQQAELPQEETTEDNTQAPELNIWETLLQFIINFIRQIISVIRIFDIGI